MSVPATQSERGFGRPDLRLVVPREDLPLVSERTCAKCGAHTPFVREANEGWYVCSSCGRYA